ALVKEPGFYHDYLPLPKPYIQFFSVKQQDTDLPGQPDSYIYEIVRGETRQQVSHLRRQYWQKMDM
ncbi:MAG TPA: hypothetical protein VIQ03_11160, partial [Gammaproteobacteria bacterium]